MKKIYRRKFILGAMIAFSILMLVLISGMLLLNYLQMEHASDSFLNSVFHPQEDYHSQQTPPMFGYRIGDPASPFRFAIYDIDTEGNIVFQKSVGTDEPENSVKEKLLKLWQAKKENAKLEAYKIQLEYSGDGSAKVILLDNTSNVQALYHTLRSSLITGALSIFLMLLILLPVSSKIADSYVKNNERQNRFITNAGHDLKTPLAIILTNLDAMELIAGSNKWSMNIRSQAERLCDLTNALLSLARANEALPEGRMEMADLAALIRLEAASFSENLQKKGLSLKINSPQELQSHIYRDFFIQMIHILFDNTVQYACSNSEVQVTLKLEKRTIKLNILNRIDKKPCENPEELFTRFFRGDSARNQASGGYGIGLSAARSIIEMHHGNIRAFYPDKNHIELLLEWKQ